MEKEKLIHLTRTLKVSELSGDKVMIDFESGKYYMLQGVANDIWEMIQTDITFGDLIAKLLEEYDVSEEECTASTADFLEKLEKNGIIA